MRGRSLFLECLEAGSREEWRQTVAVVKKVSDDVLLRSDKELYETPRLIEHGSVAKMTGKPSTRGDGSMGSQGNKGMGA